MISFIRHITDGSESCGYLLNFTDFDCDIKRASAAPRDIQNEPYLICDALTCLQSLILSITHNQHHYYVFDANSNLLSEMTLKEFSLRCITRIVPKRDRVNLGLPKTLVEYINHY